MRTHSRHALGLVLLLLLAAVLSGCFRSAGGSLEPTPVAFNGDAPVEEETPPIPTETPTEVVETEPTEEPTEEAVAILPTAEIATEPPTPLPLPDEGDVAALPGDQGGAGMEITPTQPVIAMLPTNTTAPLPTIPPTIGPTPTFTSVPFNPLPPTPTFTQFMPPAEGEAIPLGELGPGTPPAEEAVPPVEGQGGLEIAQVSTITIPQMTSTALIAEYNMTQAAIQGTIFPTNTPDPAAQPPADQGLGVQEAPPGPEGVGVEQQPTPAPAAPAGICSEHLIAPGENLFRLSQRYGVSVDAIAQANNLVNPALILAGNTLQIPCQTPGTTQPPSTGARTGGTGGSPATYIVQPGDNLYRISIRFGVSMSALMNANGMTPATINFLRAGQTLIIP